MMISFGGHAPRIRVLCKNTSFPGTLQPKALFPSKFKTFTNPSLPQYFRTLIHIWEKHSALIVVVVVVGVLRAVLRGEYVTFEKNDTPSFPQDFELASKNKNGAV